MEGGNGLRFLRIGSREGRRKKARDKTQGEGITDKRERGRRAGR